MHAAAASAASRPLTTDGVIAVSRSLAGRVTAHRRHLHRRPELGFAEQATAAYIEAVLDGLGVAHRRSVGTGVVAVLPGGGRRTVAVRADMDGLPVPEAPGRFGYRSEIEGLSHACGHDAHVAVALGLAELLGATGLPGTVVLLFQPAEEGPGGAAPMVAEGVLDDPAPEAVLALHVSTRYPTGTIAVRPGPFTASDDAIDLVVHGVGGHAAHPETALDPVPVAAQIVTGLQQLMTREVDPLSPAVLTFGTVSGGTRRNVIAPSVRLQGTLRVLDPGLRAGLVRRIGEVAQGIGSAFGTRVEVQHVPGYPSGVNDAELCQVLEDAAVATVGEGALVAAEATLGAEDFFAFGATGLPLAMFQLGVANPSLGITAPNHSADFDIDEAALPAGVAVLAEAVRRLLVR